MGTSAERPEVAAEEQAAIVQARVEEQAAIVQAQVEEPIAWVTVAPVAREVAAATRSVAVAGTLAEVAPGPAAHAVRPAWAVPAVVVGAVAVAVAGGKGSHG